MYNLWELWCEENFPSFNCEIYIYIPLRWNIRDFLQFLNHSIKNILVQCFVTFEFNLFVKFYIIARNFIDKWIKIISYYYKIVFSYLYCRNIWSKYGYDKILLSLSKILLSETFIVENNFTHISLIVVINVNLSICVMIEWFNSCMLTQYIYIKVF